MDYNIIVAGRGAAGSNPFEQWFDGLQPVVGTKVSRAVRGLEKGNFGDSKLLKGGIRERRIHSGPGYRVYYAIDQRTVVVLNAGTKQTQSNDIRKARALWYEYKTQSR
jgi:putative addiction module killer protein